MADFIAINGVAFAICESDPNFSWDNMDFPDFPELVFNKEQEKI